MDVAIREEEPRDRAAVFAVHQSAFGREDEARLVDALRDGGYARLSLVAENGDDIVGHILFSRLPIIGKEQTHESLALAPVAVLPEAHGRGIGSRLIRAGLERCRALGYASVIVLGEPGYYGRFGFSADKAARLASPYAGEYFLALELVPGALAGVAGEVEYPPPFAGL